METWGLPFLGRSYSDEEIFFPYGSLSIKDGSEIRFWEDNG
jgi:hypothetical protein